VLCDLIVRQKVSISTLTDLQLACAEYRLFIAEVIEDKVECDVQSA